MFDPELYLARFVSEAATPSSSVLDLGSGSGLPSLLLAAVEALPALSAAGAKQLAADVGYLSNIFAAGLSLPHAELTELEGLLTCDLAGLPATAESAVALRPAFAAAVADW